MSSRLTEGSKNSKKAPMQLWKRHFNIVLYLSFIAIVITTGVITFRLLSPAHASQGDNINVDRLNAATLSNTTITHHHSSATAIHANVLNQPVTQQSTGITLPYNNVGTIMDKGTTTTTVSANFDGGGYSYSQNALIKSGLYSGASWYNNSNYYQVVVLNGTTFYWPNVAYGQPDNIAAKGQRVSFPAIANASSLGFIGSATNGPASGTATITYTDGSQTTFTLGFDDWTLRAGTVGVSSLDQIATAMTYRDASGGIKQNIKTYLFYKGVSLNTSKTIQSVTLPNKSSIHIFSIGFRNASFFNPFSNTGISDDANTKPGNLDGGGHSYSMQEMSRYILPGDGITYNGTQMYWPSTLGGWPDNIPSGNQGIGYRFNSTYASGKIKIGFIGSSTSGPSCGKLTIHFTDNTSATPSLCFSDWTLNGGTQSPINGNAYFLGFPDRNISNGTKQGVKSFLFYTEVFIPNQKTIANIALPTSANQGQLHIFAFGLGQGFYNMNVGTTADSNTHLFGNLDGHHDSFSNDAMQKAGMVPVKLQTQSPGVYNYLNNLNYNGVNFYWDQNSSVFPDNRALMPSKGQILPANNPTPNEESGTIPINPVTNPTTVALLGTSTNGSNSVVVTIIYDNGAGDSQYVSFSDWCATTPSFGNQIALTMPYRNSLTGSQAVTNHLYYAEFKLTPGVVAHIVSIQVDDAQTGPGQVHVFALGFK